MNALNHESRKLIYRTALKCLERYNQWRSKPVLEWNLKAHSYLCKVEILVEILEEDRCGHVGFGACGEYSVNIEVRLKSFEPFYGDKNVSK